MKSRQQFEAKAMAVALGLLIAASPTFAGRGAPGDFKSTIGNLGTIQLANTGAEPAAVGEASLRQVKQTTHIGYPASWTSYSGTLVLRCKKLTPGATYVTPIGSFTADSNGTGSISGTVACAITEWTFSGFDGGITVARINADGSQTPVLYGWFATWPMNNY